MMLLICGEMTGKHSFTSSDGVGSSAGGGFYSGDGT